MYKFKLGDRLVWTKKRQCYSALAGAIAIVTCDCMESDLYVEVKWEQENGLALRPIDGTYEVHHFELGEGPW